MSLSQKTSDSTEIASFSRNAMNSARNKEEFMQIQIVLGAAVLGPFVRLTVATKMWLTGTGYVSLFLKERCKTAELFFWR
jgi:hypothetical protein